MSNEVLSILHSVIDCDPEISQGNLIRNFSKLQDEVSNGLNFGAVETYSNIYKYLLDYYTTNLEMPTIQTVYDYFRETNEIEVIEKIKDLQVARPYARTNFVRLLENLKETQNRVSLTVLLKETHEIANKGIENKKNKEKIIGAEAAINYLLEKIHTIQISNPVKISVDVRKQGELLREEYKKGKEDKGNVVGIPSGIRELDEVCYGIHAGNLWIHAAYTAELKTTFSINWGYKAVTEYRKGVVFVSLEMRQEDLRRSIYTIHSGCKRFEIKGYNPINYDMVKKNLLTPEEEDFWLNHVITDFESNPTYTRYQVVTPDRDWTIDDVRLHLEALHREFEIGMIVLDHAQLFKPRKTQMNRDYVISLNSIIEDAKRLALTFNHNKGIPVLLLMQINREGKAAADKNNGVYPSLNCLTYSNAAEKSADVVTTTYLNPELRGIGQTVFTTLKNRDNKIIPPFSAMVDLAGCRKMKSAPASPSSNALREAMDDADDMTRMMEEI
jgi:replicative DNA helicase